MLFYIISIDFLSVKFLLFSPSYKKPGHNSIPCCHDLFFYLFVLIRFHSLGTWEVRQIPSEDLHLLEYNHSFPRHYILHKQTYQNIRFL